MMLSERLQESSTVACSPSLTFQLDGWLPGSLHPDILSLICGSYIMAKQQLAWQRPFASLQGMEVALARLTKAQGCWHIQMD